MRYYNDGNDPSIWYNKHEQYDSWIVVSHESDDTWSWSVTAYDGVDPSCGVPRETLIDCGDNALTQAEATLLAEATFYMALSNEARHEAQVERHFAVQNH